MNATIISLIHDALGDDREDVQVVVSETPEHGHYSSSIALRIAKRDGRNPMEVAESLAQFMRKQDNGAMFQRIDVAPPGFINFWLSEHALHESFQTIVKAGSLWGTPDASFNKGTVVIDYSHPNIAKPMSVAHLRSTIIGNALYRTFTFCGWKTIGDNHLGDWGKQFGILIAAYKEHPIEGDITIERLMKLYVDYNRRMKEDNQLEERAREEIKKLQEGDVENKQLWQSFYDVSLREFERFYNLLDISFDYYNGESFYNNRLPTLVKEALQRGVAQESEGAIVIPTSTKTPFLIRKQDGAYLYSTTDIAAVEYRVREFKPTHILYVVDNGQSLHFQQLFEAVKKLGFIHQEVLVHVKFGLLLGEDLKKLSTRAGKHISLEAVIDEAIQRARAIVQSKREDLSEEEQETIARMVGLGALKYNDLSQNRQSDITFQWDKMLNLEGNSAPYIMYTHARLCSILRKSDTALFDASSLHEPGEFMLVLRLLQFPDVVKRVTELYYPHFLTDYLFTLAKEANQFYQTVPVLKADATFRAVRLRLIKAVADTLKTGLGLLGISAPEKM
ncbi:MAG: arginine--tRNA ligase [Candidatus Harrisonbacteria bacterium CG10_big_fil_rev_8_21_14_0_10_42_17]|uniref:Arginine--tRNA ligase n=1 Tax=Candidatus Harrisonbacteria bacterium CG10_big_fil_rev_8_21_14_0_10_42_17 TaxID=1974584 RepID=A0A2M6WJ93_9BACT|nr:MAG: arginine--tRNA ligase [Candidatus Harrisonbacteria bacterium CG10_big_fil_rev_8_21_14_0_10_42_17]